MGHPIGSRMTSPTGGFAFPDPSPAPGSYKVVAPNKIIDGALLCERASSAAGRDSLSGAKRWAEVSARARRSARATDSAIRLIAARRVVPLVGDLRHRSRRGAELLGLHRVAHLATLAPALDEAGPVEDGELLGHRLARNRQIAGERGRGRLSPSQEIAEQPAAGGVGDGRPQLVDLGGGGTHGRAVVPSSPRT